MKRNISVLLLALLFLISCNKDKEILSGLAEYNTSMESKGYHFGDAISFPKSVLDNAEKITISFGDKETSDLKISPEFFTLGDNAVTINIKTKDGKDLSQDAIINVFAKNAEQKLTYEIVKEYPHNPENFVQGFQLEGNMIYGSNGQAGKSSLIKYPLGSTTATAKAELGGDYFGEGSTIVGNKVYQLTWTHKKGFIYDKNSLKQLAEFAYPSILGEGWGLTYDGKNLLASDGSKYIYFLNPEKPEQLIKQIAVAGNTEIYDKLNELEYYEGFLYANMWQKPYILKINPKNGEVVGKLDLSEIVKNHTKGEDDVLNGIAFKNGNMLVTGKNWDKIYELKIN